MGYFSESRQNRQAFLLTTIESMFEEQADFHDELGLYMGEYVDDSGHSGDRSDDDDDCPDVLDSGNFLEDILDYIIDEDDDDSTGLGYEDSEDDDCRYGIGSGDDCLGCPCVPPTHVHRTAGCPFPRDPTSSAGG